MDELVVLHVAVGRQPVFFGRLAHALAHVRDQVLQQEVPVREHVGELLQNFLETDELVFDPDHLIGMDPGFVDDREGVCRRDPGHCEGRARALAGNRLAADSFLEQQAHVLDVAQGPG